MQTNNQTQQITVSLKDLASSSKADLIHILHVDDDTSILEISKQILMDMGNFEIDHSCCVDDAYKKLATFNYDVIVSDYDMSQKNGLEFLKELREARNEIPFILFTGKGREEVAIKALNLGSDAYINKAGDPETVYGELSHALYKTIERKRSKKLLADSEQKYRRLIEDMSQGVIIVEGPKPRIVFANSAMERMTGFSSQELFSFSPAEIANLIHPDDRFAFLHRLGQRLAGEKQESAYEFKGIRKDGSMTWLEVCSSLIEYDGQRLVQGVFLDITQRKNAEMKLIESEAKYRSMFDNAEAGMFRTKLDGSEILDCNEMFLKILNFTRGEVQSSPSMVHWADPLQRQEMIRLLQINGRLSGFECKLLNKQGEIRTCIGSISICPEKGILEGSVIDITDRKKAEEALKESEERYHSLSSATFEGIVISREGKILDVNSQLAKMLGSEPNELVGTNVSDCVAPESLDLVIANIKNSFEGPYEHLAKRKNNSVFPVEVRAKLINYKGYPARVSAIRDITDYKEAGKELENNKLYFETLLNSILSGVIVVDSETHEIIDANPAALGLIGIAKEEVVGKVCHKFICPAEIGKCPITDLGQTIDKAERAIITVDGRRPVIKSVVKTNHKGKTLLVENFVDISALKKIEENLKQNQKHLEMMNEKLKFVGELTRHDVRNKLSAINGYSYIIKKKLVGQPNIAIDLDKIGQSIKQIERIFDFAKVYEYLGVEKLVFVNVGSALDYAKALFSGSLPIIVNDCHFLNVAADSFLQQMFYNFIDNTNKHGKNVTTIIVHYEENNNHLKLFYEDDGVGISAENKIQLFKEGFSTEGSTGFGLFLSKKMIEVYGWQIEEIGEPGKGVKFVITIPKTKNNGEVNYQIQH
ncbi:MAG TPA: PAS domain S-box protein [Candidatus Acidoferrum sp.]|nr:PAS domain S-box protein [Candidatus Acidoferrum sp.]